MIYSENGNNTRSNKRNISLNNKPSSKCKVPNPVEEVCIEDE